MDFRTCTYVLCPCRRPGACPRLPSSSDVPRAIKRPRTGSDQSPVSCSCSSRGIPRQDSASGWLWLSNTPEGPSRSGGSLWAFLGFLKVGFFSKRDWFVSWCTLTDEGRRSFSWVDPSHYDHYPFFVLNSRGIYITESYHINLAFLLEKIQVSASGKHRVHQVRYLTKLVARTSLLKQPSLMRLEAFFSRTFK